MPNLYGVLITAGVLAIQYFFSTRNSGFWGALIPVVYIVFLTWMFVTNRIESALSFVLALILGILFLFGEWIGGRKYLREKRRKELDKMKTLDLK